MQEREGIITPNGSRKGWIARNTASAAVRANPRAATKPSAFAAERRHVFVHLHLLIVVSSLDIDLVVGVAHPVRAF
jgi:hypothetical protein